MACRINRGQEWSVRLLHELDYHKNCLFITFTYNDDNVPDGYSLVKKDIVGCIKRIRAKLDYKIKYYVVGEYGDRYNRPHYHGIFFGCDKGFRKVVSESWNCGFVYFGSVTKASINYVTRYVNKKLYGKMAKEEYGNREAPFAIMSKGLGSRWLEENKDQLLLHGGVRKEGKTVRAPRYYYKLMERKQEGIIPLDLVNFKSLERGLKKDIERERQGIEAVDLSKADRESREQRDRDLKWFQENIKRKSNI